MGTDGMQPHVQGSATGTGTGTLADLQEDDSRSP